MNVLALTNLYPNPLQPQRAPFNRQQLRVLAESHRVRVIAPVLWTDEWSARRRSPGVLPSGRRVEHDGLTVDHPRYWYTPKILRCLYGRFFLASVRRTFRAAVREFQPDIVYAPWAYPDGYAAERLAREAGLPVVIKLHGSDLLQLDQYAGRVAGTVAALREADGLIAVSQDLANRAIAMGASPQRVHVVVDGVDRELFSPGDRTTARQPLGLPADVRQLLFVGNLVPVKGIDVLLDACRRLPAAVGPWQLHLLGDGPLRASLQALAAKYGLHKQVCFHGVVPHSSLPNWYRAADLLVLPSRSEGIPNVLLEAAACELPYVASAVGGIPEIAGQAASRLVPPEQPDPLAAAIAQMLHRSPPAGPGPRDRREAVAEIAAVLERCVAERSLRPSYPAALTA
jgi:glycosyltransferase involved in cell wall biosynthesis